MDLLTYIDDISCMAARGARAPHLLATSMMLYPSTGPKFGVLFDMFMSYIPDIPARYHAARVLYRTVRVSYVHLQCGLDT